MRIGKLTLAAAAYAAPFVVFLAVYLPAAGHGFIADDFGWILHNRVRGFPDLWRIAVSDNGFYRPAVAFSFAVNELIFGLHPRAYGLTNVALAALCGGAVYGLCRALSLSQGAAAFAAALWLLNFHGVNMAVLWISGRTTLIATLAAAFCTTALLRGRSLVAAAWLALALFSREDAALLPLVTTIWVYVLKHRLNGGDPCTPPRHPSAAAALGAPPSASARGAPTPRSASARSHVFRWLATSSAMTAAYFAIRSTTNAMTPATAPVYYQFTGSAATLLRNAGEYADRTSTLPVAVLVVLALVLRPVALRLDARSRALCVCGLVWLVGFLLPALLLPVRSSLYACLPSVGVCVVAAALGARMWSLAADSRRTSALVVAVLLPLLLWPVYHARTRRWVGLAQFSTQALSDLQIAARGLPDDSDILVVDDRSPRANMASVFSTLLRDAFLLTSGRFMNFYVDPPIPNAGANSGGAPVCAGCVDLRLAVKNGRLIGDRGSGIGELPTPNFQLPKVLRVDRLRLVWELGVGGWELTSPKGF